MPRGVATERVHGPSSRHPMAAPWPPGCPEPIALCRCAQAEKKAAKEAALALAAEADRKAAAAKAEVAAKAAREAAACKEAAAATGIRGVTLEYAPSSSSKPAGPKKKLAKAAKKKPAKVHLQPRPAAPGRPPCASLPARRHRCRQFAALQPLAPCLQRVGSLLATRPYYVK